MPLAALSSFCAPTARVLPSPLKDTRTPNQSSRSGFEDFRKACSVQVVPLRTQIYTAPAVPAARCGGCVSTSHPGALTPGTRQPSSPEPATTVLPSSLMLNETPMASLPCDREPLR